MHKTIMFIQCIEKGLIFSENLENSLETTLVKSFCISGIFFFFGPKIDFFY